MPNYVQGLRAHGGIYVDGNIVFTQPMYNDYLVPGLALETTGPNSPDIAELRDGLYLTAFAGTGATVEQGFFSLHLLHDLKKDSTPTFHVHWTHNQASPTGDVKWFIDYSFARGYGLDTFPAPTTLSYVQTAGAQYTHHITDDDSMAVNEANLEPDGQLICRLYRDPADAEDTFAADAFVIGVDMHYQMGQIATKQRNRPFKTYG